MGVQDPLQRRTGHVPGHRVPDREAGVAVLAVAALADNAVPLEHLETGHQLCPPRAGDAVHGPRPAVGVEVRRAGRVPVLGEHDQRPGGAGGLDLGAQQPRQVLTAGDVQAPGRVGEVVLQVDDHQRGPVVVVERGAGRGASVAAHASPR